MNKKTPLTIKSSAQGERAAIGGYKPQYDEFARCVYDCILDDSLEEIRVADDEENVGKLDDICYVTTDKVHAYQVKWTTVDHHITYNDFCDYLKGIVDGWRKLCVLYRNKTVVAHLLTNRECSLQDRSIVNNAGKKIGGFNDFVTNVLPKLCVGDVVPTEWYDIIPKLKASIGLKDEEWSHFWKSFVFTYGYKQEIIDVSNSMDDTRTEDIITLNRLIQQLVASPDRIVQMTKDDIIATLKWDRRLKPLYDHNLSVSIYSYEPISDAIEQLNAKLANKTKGYIFLQGTPGSGKSTILTQWVKTIPNRSIRYYAFDFTDPSSNYNNDDSRGESITFLADMVRMIDASGFKVKVKALPSKRDYDALKHKFYEQLNKISEDYIKTGLPTVLVVDGLDHITREYVSCTQTLMRILPTPEVLPDGVIFILGSQHFNKLQLDKSIEILYNQGDGVITMPSFRHNEVETLALRILNVEAIEAKIVDLMMEKSQGHPLYLRYILNEVLTAGYDVLENMPPYDGNIEAYYERILGEHMENAGMKHFLGLLSRFFGSVHLNFIKEWNIDDQVLIDFKNKLHHLFLWDCGGTEISFFHNSFRQFLMEKTASDILDGRYNEDINRKLYSEIADFCHKSTIEPQWNEAAYRYQAEEYDEFVKLMHPDLLQEQLLNFRPVWNVMRDVNCMIGIAAKRKNIYQLTRYMLFKSQLNQMEMQDYSGITLTEELLALDNIDAAKMQIRENKTLHCSQEYALTLSRVFKERGDMLEANFLFELAYPEFLSHRIDEFHNKYNAVQERFSILKEWVYTAVFFMPIEVIDSKIDGFIEYLHLFAAYDNENFDANKADIELRQCIINALIYRGQLADMDSYLCSHFAENVVLKYVSYRNLMVEQNKNGDQENAIKTFEVVKDLFEQIPDKDKPYLQMAILSYRSNESVERVEQYLSHVLWSSLGSVYLSFHEKFEALLPHLRYEELRSYCGYDDNVMELVPTDISKADNALMEDYARKLICLAKIKGNARRRNTSIGEFTVIARNSITFMDSAKKQHHNKYSYTISSQREDFYKYIIDIANEFGGSAISNLVVIFGEHFLKSSCNASPDEKRQTILELYKVGADKNQCTDMLNVLGQTMMKYQDLDGRASNVYKQGKAWLILGEREIAEGLFHQMIEESFGIGYRKDYQPTTMAEWIGAANKYDPNNAISRIHWMTQRLHYINDVSESRICSDAALQLLEDAISLNFGLGLSLAKWILDSEYSYFEAVSRILIKASLKLVQNTSDYRIVFLMYSSLHLYACESYDTDTSLLESICDKGHEVLEDCFGDYINKLRCYILTQCSENQHDAMLSTLDKFLSSDEQNKSHHTETRRSKLLCQEADNLCSNGMMDDAWGKIIEALDESSPSGWIRYYDGGTRLDACKMLIKINSQKGREIAWSLLANDMSKGECYAFMNSWDEIIPLLDDNIDMLRLFNEQFAYMNRVLRENTITECDKPELAFTSQSIPELVFGWLSYVAQMSVLCIAYKAKMLMAEMIVEDCSLVSDILNCPDRLILEVAMYVRELDKTKLGGFKNIALKSVKSPNYQYRIYGKAILSDLGEDIPVVQRKQLPGIYNLILPEVSSLDFGQNNPYGGNVDWNNPSSVMKVASHLQLYLTYVSDIEKTIIDRRAMQLMLHYGSIVDWTDEVDTRLGNHYQNIGLRFPYRRPRAQAALDGMMEVAAELADTGVLKSKYDDVVFMNIDFSEIKIIETIKPEFIQRIADINSFSVDKGWKNKAAVSIRFEKPLQNYNGRFVIGEWTRIVKPDDEMSSEEYMMKVNYDMEKPSSDNFFGDSHFQCLTSQYLYRGIDSSDVIIVRDGYFVNHRATQKWIAINPACAYTLGWKPSQEGLFAWNDLEGERMVESVYWQCGNTHYHNRCNFETSEGWLVLASPKALEALKNFDRLFSCQMVMRRNLTEHNVCNNVCCKVTEI